MNDKKSKYNFTPKSIISKSNHKTTNHNLNEDIKRNLYQNDLRILKKNQIKNDKIKGLNNKFLTDLIANSNEELIKNENNNISQLLTKYLENLQKNGGVGDEQIYGKDEKNSDWEENINANNKDNTDDNLETCNNSSELKYLISTNEKEKIDFISTLLKLKGINSDRKGNSDKYLSSIGNYKNFSNNLKKALKYSEKINQKKSIIESIITNNDFSKSNEINLTDENNNIKKQKIENNKKLKEKNRNIIINKTLSVKKGNIKQVTINLMDSDESYIQMNNLKKKKEKSFDNKKSNIKTSETKKLNKIHIAKTKSLNKSPISTRLLKTKRLDNNHNNKNIKLKIIKDDYEGKIKNKKNSFLEKKNENEKINKKRKKSNDATKYKTNEIMNKKKGKSKDKKDNKKEEKKGDKKPIYNTYKNNIRNYDSRKLKRVQNHIFSVIDELDEEAKGDTINTNNKTKKNGGGNEEKKENENIPKKTIQLQNEINTNNNKYGLKNNNISIISNDTFSNEVGFTDKKLLTSFLSSSTFNNDLVNYKPTEKNSSNLLIYNNNINMNNTNFSIINNSNLNIIDNNTNINNTLFTQTNNNNSKNNISEVIPLNPENEDKTSFLIENNSKIINEIDPNDISDIAPLENKDITLDYKINVYDNNKLGNGQNENEISSNDEEAESIIDQFDIINNKIQNESKEIKLSEIKNKETLNDISNSNISITNISKFTNFADSNIIKFGEISRLSNKIIKNSEAKKNNTNMEVITESEQNSNNNTNNSKTNKQNDTNIKRIEHKTIKKINNKKNNENDNYENKIINDFINRINNNHINGKEDNNDNYFCIKDNGNNEINDNKNEKINETIKKEPKDSVRNDEPKDNFRNKNKNLYYKELKQKYKSTNISNKNIFEDEDFSLSKKLVNTNKKDIVIIDSDDDENIRIHSIKNKNIKKISLKGDKNFEILKERQANCSPTSVIFNNKIKEEFSKNIINNNKMQFNNVKIDKISLKNIKNNSINEMKSKTLKIKELNYLTSIPNINNTLKCSNLYRNHSPSPYHYSNEYLINENNINNTNKLNENQRNDSINEKMTYNNINMTDNLNNNNKKLIEQRNFYFNNNNQVIYNNIFPSNDNIIELNKLNTNKDIIEYYYQNGQISPKVMNINNIYKINEPYNVYIQ